MNRQQTNQTYYQKNKAKLQAQRQARYQAHKQAQQTQTNSLYQAHNIQVLLSLKHYTELNKEKHKLWLDFQWALQDLHHGISDIVQVMKLTQVAQQLITDYWTTAKNEERQKGQSWDSLDYDQQQRLIKYWGREKARKEQAFANQLTELDQQGTTYESEIALAKFHEQRGTQGCTCETCQTKQALRTKIKQEFWASLPDSGREPCAECGKLVKELDEENGLCHSCLTNYE